MKFERIVVEGVLGLPDAEHIVIEREDGSFESFPADAENPRYIQFLAELEETA